MRTLKKVLALSLVFAMAFTMMAGAAFKDQDKIDPSLNNDIQLLTALGVFKGDENGNFNPEANVKRSEAAKMIYVLKNNGIDDGAVAFQGVSRYADVPVGHWAEGYINYCTNLGYMGGWKAGNVQKFDPDGNVTGVELMKMLLCMIGYKADMQGYTGNGWQTNVLSDAATSGLSVNFIPSVYGATPRQWTARLMVNAIDAHWVNYSKGELTYQSETYGEQFLKLVTVEGTLTETNHNKLAAAKTANKGKMQAALNNTDTVVVVDKKDDPHVAVGEADAALLGQPVKMYYKANTATEDKLYAVLPYSKDKVVVETAVDAVKVKDGKVTVEGLGTKTYTAADKFSVYSGNVLVQDIVTGGRIGEYLGNNVNDNATLVADKNTGKIEMIKYDTLVGFAEIDKIDAANGIFKMSQVSTWMNGVNSGKFADENDQALTFDKANKDNFAKYLNVAEGVKDGSIVKVVVDLSSGKPVYNITLADKVEGKVTGYNLNSDNTAYATLTVNGTALKLAGGTNEMNGYDWNKNDVNKHDTFYTDGKYVVFSTASEEVVSVNNLAYIIDTDFTEAWGEKTFKVKALLADGTQGEYVVAATYDKAGKKTDEAQVVGGVKEALLTGVMTYSLSDGKITLKEIDNSASTVDADGKLTFMKAAAGLTVDKKSSVATIDGKQYKVVDSTILFVKNGDKYSVVKAADLQNDVKTNTVTDSTFAVQKVNGFETLLAGVVEGALPVAVEDYYFVTGKPNYVGKVDDKHVIEMPVNAAGTDSKLTFKFDDDSNVNGDLTSLAAFNGKLVKVEQTGDSLQVGDVKQININGNWKKGALTAWDGKNAVLDGQYVGIVDGAKIFNVDVAADGKSAKLVEGDKATLSEDGTKTNAVYLTNDDGKIVAIFTEVDGADASFIAQ